MQTKNIADIIDEKLHIAFRADDFNYLKQPLKFVAEKDYKIGDLKVFEANELKAFWVEIKK